MIKLITALLLAVSLYSQGVVVIPGGIGTIPGSTGGGSNPSTSVYLTRATDQAGTDKYCRSTSGNDTYVCGVTPTLTVYTTGSCLVLNGDTANTGAATINVNSLGAKSILSRAGSALSNGDITANAPITICYDGTQFIIQGDGGSGSTSLLSGTLAAIPATCTVGAALYQATDEPNTNQIYACTSTNTWTRVSYTQGTTAPVTCTLGQLFFDTNATAGSNFLLCTATDTWTAISGSSAVSSVTAGPTGAIICSPTTGAVICDANTAYVPILTGSNVWTGANDFSTASLTAPMRVAVSAPATCDATKKEMYFNSTTSLAYACTATNTWTAMGGSQITVPTYMWSDMCRRGSQTADPPGTGWLNINGTFSPAAFASQPACTASLTVSGSGDNARVYQGDGGDKVVRLDGDWDFSFDLTPTAQNDKEIKIGVVQGTTITNDGCWIYGNRVDGTTAYVLYCRASGADGAATTMTGTTISATRATYRIRRVSGTVYASINGGTEFTTTASLPVTTSGGAPMIQWINDVGGASGTIYIHNTGMAR